MNGNNSRVRGVAIVAVLLLSAIAAVVAYNVGVSHGVAQQVVAQAAQGSQGAQPLAPYGYPYPYGWYRPWGFGFFPILFFALLWFGLMRGLVWGGRWRACAGGWRGVPPAFDEWHRQAHERLKEHPPADDPGRRG